MRPRPNLREGWVDLPHNLRAAGFAVRAVKRQSVRRRGGTLVHEDVLENQHGLGRLDLNVESEERLRGFEHEGARLL